MPLDRLVLILVIVIAAAGLTVWLSTLAFVAVELSPAVGFMAFPVLLILYLVWRVIAERLKNREDDYYDHIEK